ncbi:replication initiation protein [Francisella philomiragia]|uniref:Initiator Replication family protein n=3 Tax=Francisella philomiragia TaxID=28110 RepID=A0AAW3DBE7_9GAMM|nr:replication initiation protein [Francisella philomiragia]ACJ31797.1 hypothetical protein [Francisella philomiragia subsp. philomiragia ATCC 25017]KFJ43050.1 initiator Replication family protein [Francisella philomiragia]MBK2253821.1 replication initiation protein [Francisella philomiragia]MBK2255694.1 replication initiation protein [Francisella philomiragia]MBK2259589.1 replication initiation protein [Francisella philomiragia]
MKEIKDKKEIAMSNSLVAGKYHLTKEEQNLIFLVASQINSSDEDFKKYRVSITDLEKATGVKHNRVRLKELMYSIMSKPIWLDMEQTEIANWFSYIKADPKNSALICEFHWALKPHLIELSQRYTKAELEHLFSFKSKYSGRLYLLLKSEYGLQESHKVIVPATFEVDEIINRFSMPDTYKIRYSHFKESFLHKSLEEINTLTEFFVTYDVIKAGRKVWKIQFFITKPPKTTNEQIDKILNTKTKDDFIPFEASDRLKEIVLSDEVDLDTNYVKHIFEHYLLRDIENVCDTVWKSWDNAKLMSKKALFLGEIKKLNKKKTENHTFGFDEI